MSKALFDANAAMMVISGLIKDPKILHDQDNFRLSINDFDNEFYKIIFGSIFNLTMNGVEKVEPIDIDIYVAQYPQQYEIYQKNEGLDFIKTLSRQHDDLDMAKFNFHYERLKKFTILRDLEKNGISTKEFYNPTVALDKRDAEERKINEITSDDIIKAVQKRLNKVEENYISRTFSTTQKGAEGIRDLYFELKRNPEIGLPLEGEILNYILRGARFGKMYINSAPSGHGKTRFMLGNACALSLPRLNHENKIEVRDNLSKVLFVTTEQQADEIQTLMMAYVSGVNEKKILYGNATKEEEHKILMAIDIIEQYKDNFIIEVIPDPSIALVRAKLIKHILQNGIEFIFYDYIFSSPGLLGEFASIKVREDVALMMLSNTLKEVAATYNVFIQSATQLNDRWENSIVRNQNHIRGSKAISDKADVGLVSVKLSEVPEEEALIRDIAKMAGVPMPNIVTDIYKNRRGEYAGVKLFRYFDYGTCRSEDIMLTTLSHQIIKDYQKINYDMKLIDLLDLATTKAAAEEEEDDDV